MISRKSALAIAEAYTKRFSRSSTSHQWGTQYYVEDDAFYDYLYERDYPSWLANLVKKIRNVRGLKEWVMQIHTGESLVSATRDWSWEKRRELGQSHLKNLAQDFLRWYSEEAGSNWIVSAYEKHYDEIRRRLQLDGYVFVDGELRQASADVLDVEAETGLLEGLYQRLSLSSSTDAFEFLRLAEIHFLAARWSDAIGNARKFFELTLKVVALRLSQLQGFALSEAVLERPVAVRDLLEEKELLEKREREAVDKIYGLLSHTGAHPYMAEEDQARLLRQMALTTTQFVLLRLDGASRAR